MILLNVNEFSSRIQVGYSLHHELNYRSSRSTKISGSIPTPIIPWPDITHMYLKLFLMFLFVVIITIVIIIITIFISIIRIIKIPIIIMIIMKEILFVGCV